MRIGQGTSGRKDFVTSALKVISVEHANIHEGVFYSVPNIIIDIASESTACLEFRTPVSEYVHYRNEKLSCSADKLTLQLLEDSVVTGGTTVSSINHNRESTKTAGTIVKTGTTLTSAGTVVSTAYIGGGTGLGGSRTGDETSDNNEYVLKRDTIYAILLTNDSSTTNTVHVDPQWYEEFEGE